MNLQANKRAWYGLTAITCISILAVIILSIILAVNNSSAGSKEEPEAEAEWQKQPISASGSDVYLYNSVATDSAVCSTLADYVMNVKRGNAMDAAVTALLCVGVSNLHSAGIGGGSFMVFYNRSNKEAKTYNFRETAPLAASRNMYTKLARNASIYGGLAIAIPGEVAGLKLAHSRHGRLNWTELVLPLAQLLRVGKRVTKPMADAVAGRGPLLPDVPPFDVLKRWLRNPSTGELYKTGDILRDETLADTMETIATDPDSFYNGELADKIVAEIQNAGGIITKLDLQDYQARESEPLTLQLRSNGMLFYTMPPPSSGAVLSLILNVLDGYGFPAQTVKRSLNSYVTFLHRIVEAFKFGFAKRSALGDAAFVNVSQIIHNLTSHSYADYIRQQITDDRTHDIKYYGPSFEWAEDSGTSHISIVDSDGNAVSVTSTINTRFGSLVRGNSTGIIYNNEMDDFSSPNRTNFFGLPPSPSNYIEPKKRPMSSMAPIVITDAAGDVKFVSGASGGTRITTSIAYNLARQLFLNETVKEAADAFRLHHQLVPNAIRYFDRDVPIPEEIRKSLEAKGHEFTPSTSFSVVNGIQRMPDGRLQANADFRKPSKTGGF